MQLRLDRPSHTSQYTISSYSSMQALRHLIALSLAYCLHQLAQPPHLHFYHQPCHQPFQQSLHRSLHQPFHQLLTDPITEPATNTLTGSLTNPSLDPSSILTLIHIRLYYSSNPGTSHSQHHYLKLHFLLIFIRISALLPWNQGRNQT